MMRAMFGLAMTVSGLILASSLEAQSTRALDSPGQSPIVTTKTAIRASLNRISAGSPSWREAETSVSRTGRRIVIVTPEQVVVADPSGKRRPGAFDESVLAEVGLVPSAGPVESVLVVVNLPLLEEAHLNRRSLEVEQDADLDRIIIHEVYGHAIPYALSGSESGRCSDPTHGQRAEDACSIQRENVVRHELGLGRRTDYGLNGLFLARLR